MASIPPIAPSPPPSPGRSGSIRRSSMPAVLEHPPPLRSPRRPRTSEGSPRPKLLERAETLQLAQTLPRRSSSNTSNGLERLSQTLPRPSTSGSRSGTPSPTASPRPPSSPSGRNGPSPLSRRYDLKPPVPSANAAYQVNTPAPLRNAALLTRITQMRLPEAMAVVEAITSIEDEGESEVPVLCEAFHQRVAELLNHVQLSNMGGAVALISRMSEAAETLPLLKPEGQLNAILESRLNYFLGQSARILDARVENNVHNNRNQQGGLLSEFDHLLQCHRYAEILGRNGMASLKSVKKAMEHLLRLVESAPLVDLQHRVQELRRTNEVALEDALVDRVRHITLKGRNLTDMGAFAQALVTMHQKMELPMLLPEVEEVLCSEIPGLIKLWSLERLQMECETQAGLQTLSQASSRVWDCINNELSNRLFQWVCETVSALRQTRSLDRAQGEINRWKKMTLRAISAGMVVFTAEAKDKIISLFSRCYDDCLGNASFSHCADEIDRMHFQVAVIMGEDRRANSELRKAGTIGTKPGLPMIKVVGCI